MSGRHHTQESSGCSHKRSRTMGIVAWSRKRPWLIWLLPAAGLISLIWFLIRVVPKPSRAMYPCQRLAAPLAVGFVVWIAGLLGSTWAYRKARRLLQKSRYVLAAICVAAAVVILWASVSVTGSKPARAALFTPTEPANSPMGTGKGIHPGRVVWIRDPDATSWDGSTGSCGSECGSWSLAPSLQRRLTISAWPLRLADCEGT
jgi:hypothetical protein